MLRKEGDKMDYPNLDIRCERLAEAIKLSGLKQIEVSEKTGISKGSLSSYLSGRYFPKQKALYLLGNVLNVSEAWLMGFNVPMRKDEIDNPPSLRFAMLVGDRAKKLRVDKNLSIEFLAKELDTDVKTITNLEAGVDHGFDVELFYKYSVFFDVPPAFFIVEEFNEEVNIGKNIKLLMEINDISIDTIDTSKNRQSIHSIMLTDDGLDKDYVLAACCHPIPGDEVLGFVEENGIVQIHKIDCGDAQKLKTAHGKQICSANWNTHRVQSFVEAIEIRGIDKFGVLVKVLSIVATEFHINIRSIQVESEDGIFTGLLEVYVYDRRELQELFNALMSMQEVMSAHRVIGENKPQ